MQLQDKALHGAVSAVGYGGYARKEGGALHEL
jgi:hypothetical protein